MSRRWTPSGPSVNEQLIIDQLEQHQSTEDGGCTCGLDRRGWAQLGHRGHQARAIANTLIAERVLLPWSRADQESIELRVPTCAMTRAELEEGLASGRLVRGVTERRFDGGHPEPAIGDILEPCRVGKITPPAGREVVGIEVTGFVQRFTAMWQATGFAIARAEPVCGADEVVGDGPGLDAHGPGR